MTDSGIGDYFISDVDETPDEDEDLLVAPVVVPARPEPRPPAPVTAPRPAERPEPPRPASAMAPPAATVPVARPLVSAAPVSREERLVAALDDLMEHSPDVQAVALVSLDGFTMASALPGDMQEDRVGAMSAAILGLGERAAAELGRGALSQVFIEGAEGYVLLMAAGERAVLTVLADSGAKLGLTLYDMRGTADEIGTILR
jgi:predicted regulator of Ras-like GTPase activity (Roadblock/LC7/MglB family)